MQKLFSMSQLPWNAALRLISSALLALISVAHAQVIKERGPASLTLEGYGNGTAGRSIAEDGSPDSDRTDARLDAGLRALALYRRGDNALGVRGEAVFSPEDGLEAGERSVLAFGPWGRLELGKRQGLATTLYGYAPSTFAFTSAEFSVATGRSLDPGGSLATSFLAEPLAADIDAISYLGSTAALFNDLATKVAYVSPKVRGFQGGLAYAPEDSGDRFRDLVQGGLAYEAYIGRNVYRFGGSFSAARGEDVNGQRFEDLHSINLGVAATLVDAWNLGLAVTYDGDSGLLLVPGSVSRDEAWGATASLNYNSGPWTLGGYAQHAVSESDTARSGLDRLQVLQTGISYRLTTKLRFYGALYLYRFDEEGGGTSADRFRGAVLLGGVRITL